MRNHGVLSRTHSALLIMCALLTLPLAGCGLSGKVGNSTTSTAASADLVVKAEAAAVRIGSTTQLSATLGGLVSTTGQWSVSGGPANGIVSANAVYSAPASVVSPDITISYAVGGSSASVTLALQNAIPVLSGLLPSYITTPSANITATGAGFMPSSVILVDGQPVPTVYQDNSHLSAVVIAPSGSTTPINIAVKNPDPGSAVSTSIGLAVTVTQAGFTISPSALSGGPVTITMTQSGVNDGSRILLNGVVLNTISVQGNSITASGYLPPWLTGTVLVSVTGGDGTSIMAQGEIPITPTAVPFDTAARFATQAGFGPRPDVVLHIQQVGLSAFLDEQFKQPVGVYNEPSVGVVRSFFLNITSGNSLLRLRTAWALQTFIPSTLFYSNQILYAPWEETLERDAFTNYQTILTDAAGDPNIAGRLNMPGNSVSTDPDVHPNQNYARESMQLFSIGTVMLNEDGTVQNDLSGNPLPSYDQNTVIDMSRVYTGWDFPPPVNATFTMSDQDYSQPLVAFEERHDTGAKTLFGSVHLPAGQTAEQDRASAINALMTHQNIGPFVSRLLIQRFVKSQPSAAYVGRVAAVFRNNGAGVSGDMTAVLRALLLDPEARIGDTDPQPTDGFLQDSIYAQTFLMSILQLSNEDDQPSYIPKDLVEDIFNTASVFSYFSPSYKVPGTTINSPEFQLFTNFTALQRSQFLWSVASLQQPGFNNGLTGWLYENFQTLPTMLDALDHLLYHGQMPQSERSEILAYCNSLSDPNLQLESAVFLALNSDSYTVAH